METENVCRRSTMPRAWGRRSGWALLLFGLIFAGAASAEEGATATYDQCAPDGVAIGGYDLVSYFLPDGPQPGNAQHATERDGYRYLFASAENLEQFLADPDRYLPRYRGWCAATLSMGRLACPDPTNYKIENGSLLLFEQIGFTNGKTLWDTDPSGFRAQADEHARRLLQ